VKYNNTAVSQLQWQYLLFPTRTRK